VSGTIAVSATASDNVAVAGVQFKVDGVNLGAEDTAAPYSASWNTTTGINGAHSLSAVARDAAGNTATSVIGVTVANDSTAPQISGVSASSITSSGATISWTTNEASDSQVQYGPTTAYDRTTTLSTSQVTAHTALLTGLSSSTAYHYRVLSRDAAGNLTTSADFTFTTSAAPDTTAPTVSISAPTGGTTVSGTVTVAASASDNVGVVAVQFKLDGANLGAEDTLAPFSVSWNSTLASNGSHGLTAVARDAAGNQKTSAGVTVNVSNVAPPPPPPASILWAGDHEEGNMSDWYTPAGGGEFNSGNAVSGASTDVAHSGRYSAKATITTPPSPSAVRLFRWTESRPNPEAYYGAWFYFPRVYTANWWFIDQFKSRSCSSCDPDPFWFVQVANRANGNMYLNLVWWYGPWPGGTVEGPHAGEFGGRTYEQTIKDLPTNQWVHLEIFLRQSASFNGQIIVWQDGVEILRQDNVKTRYPFMGDEWSLASYAGSISPGPATIYIDDATISTARLGPGTSADSTPPTVSLSAPAPGATVSTTVSVSASAADNVGVVGVQFKVDGANWGAEDTTAPFSISWNSALFANGAHSLSAVARDAAGNTAATAPVSVTVSNTATSCQTSGPSWQNQAFAPQSGNFTAQFDATPGANNIDGVTGLAAGTAATFTDLAAIVRFNSAGNIDARNAGAYSALASIPYVAGTTYRVRMAVDVPARSYSVYVTPAGGSEQALGLNYAFRSEQAAANTLSALASFTSGGILQVCNFTVSP